jgi:hypothetical protein
VHANEAVFVITKPSAIVPTAPELRPSLIERDDNLQVTTAGLVVEVEDDDVEAVRVVVVVEEVEVVTDVVVVVVVVAAVRNSVQPDSTTAMVTHHTAVAPRRAHIRGILFLSSAKPSPPTTQYRPWRTSNGGM